MLEYATGCYSRQPTKSVFGLNGRYWPKAAAQARPVLTKSGHLCRGNDVVRRARRQAGNAASSNLSFTAIFSERKPLIFLEKVRGLWFLVSEKWAYGTDLGQMRHFGAEMSLQN
jgi:hypothetical protein